MLRREQITASGVLVKHRIELGTEVSLDHILASDLKLLQDQLVNTANVTAASPLGKALSVINFP